MPLHHPSASGPSSPKTRSCLARCIITILVVSLLLRPVLWAAKGPDGVVVASNAATQSVSKEQLPRPLPSNSNNNNKECSILATSTTSNSNMESIHTLSPPSSFQNVYIPPSLPIKTLVVLIGNLRCGEVAWTSLYQNLLDFNANNAMDLALAIGDVVDPLYANVSLYQRAKYVFTFKEYDDWSQALNQIDPSWKQKLDSVIPADSSSFALGGVGNWKGSGTISFWIRWFLSNKLVEHDLISRYDRFVITRTDHFYMCPHDLSGLDLRYLWVPLGQDWGGINDRHLVVSNQHVLDALNILPGLFQNVSQYPFLACDGYNPERLLLDRWKQMGLADKVRRFPRVMFTCANNPTASRGNNGNDDNNDATRWHTGGHLVSEGVLVKYRNEYRQSVDTCHGDENGRQ